MTDDEELKDQHPLIWNHLDMYITETEILTLKMGTSDGAINVYKSIIFNFSFPHQHRSKPGSKMDERSVNI